MRGVRQRKAPIVISAVRNLAVLGSPISHSKSPALHLAAYRVLGLDWEYTAVDVKSGELASYFASLDNSWRGLSLTMPLKREVLSLVTEQDETSREVGAANTVLFEQGEISGFNTDVYGAERMLRESLTGPLRRAVILGGGATASSVALALINLGAEELTVATRSPARAGSLAAIGKQHGVQVRLGGPDVPLGVPDVVVSTVPGGAELNVVFPEELRASVPLVDIAYDPWPTAIARHWVEADGAIVNNGLGMLIYQALAQVRIFVNGTPFGELPVETDVLAAMRSAAFGSR